MKTKASKLDRFAERLQEWFLEGKTLKEAQEELAQDGCKVSIGRLSEWWNARQSEMQEEQLLAQIASGAKHCQEVEKAMEDSKAPELKTLMALHRVLILKLATEGNADPEKLELVNRMMREVQKFARLEQLAEQNRLEERKLALLEAKAKQADQAEAVLKESISPEEQASRIREIFKK